MKALKLAAALLTTASCYGPATGSAENFARVTTSRHVLAANAAPAAFSPIRFVPATFTGGALASSKNAPDVSLDEVQAQSGSPAPPGVAPAPKIAVADNIVVTNGTLTLHIRHLEVAGSSLSGADLAALFAIKDPKALEARLRTLDASSIVIPEITGMSTDAAGETHFTQKDVVLTDVRGGRASTGSAGGATVAFKNTKTDTTVSTGATTFKGLDIGQIVHLAAGRRTDEGEAPRPICDELAIRSVTIGGALKHGQPVTIATIDATGLKGRPLKGDPNAAVDGKGEPTTLDEISHSFSAGLIEADDFALAPPTSASTDGLKRFALKHLSMHDFGDGRLSRFELNDLAVEGNDKQPGKLSLASAAVENIATNSTPVPSVDKINLDGLVLDIPTDNDPQGQRIGLSVAHAGYEAPGLIIGKLPAEASLSIAHATFDVPPDSPAAPMLLAMGYKHLDLSNESRSRYDAAEQTLDIDRFSLVGIGMGVLDIKMDLAKVSEGILSQDDSVQKAAAAAIQIKLLDLTLRNEGLVDKALGFKATIDGVTLEQERTAIAQLVESGLAGFNLKDSPKAQSIAAAVHKFILEPKTLHIALASKKGLGADAISGIDSPQALLDAVDVQASANE